jgi:hypothetical protein
MGEEIMEEWELEIKDKDYKRGEHGGYIVL